MNKGMMAVIVSALIIVGVAAAVLVSQLARPGSVGASPQETLPESTPSPAPQAGSTDPQTLLIPRWFLQSITVNGAEVALPDKHLTLQFEPNKNANGESSCNSFFATWDADTNGNLTFGEIGSTRMFCEGMMETETAYFDALTKVTQFSRPEGELILTSADGQTKLVFVMPPK